MTDQIAIQPIELSYAPPHLALDLWRPEKDYRGLVVHAHGGGFVHGSRDDRIARAYGPLLSARGIGFASISYRKGGAPRRAFEPKALERISAASSKSAAFYPNVREGLFGPALYRAAVDFGKAVAFLRSEEALGLKGCSWVAMGNSSGALAAIGVAHGLEGLEPQPGVQRPKKCIAIASVAPQPWVLSQDGPPVSLLCARGDQVFPRNDISRLDAFIDANALPVTINRIPYGQHMRPVREVLTDNRGELTGWAEWLVNEIESALPRTDG
ncbi:alpha/beta hydrolase [Yoonia litorea]|uniref:Acetyl esterase/lipase n=1 Tax=Yoonia litorea TaxID=1123755 RepID=A0A1I6MV21_9RHOB|nr:hypothetical protein [Yoonia litorea]SFS19545.1 hypothetical protein SAMN05444714_2234 [Yoonia litorea]